MKGIKGRFVATSSAASVQHACKEAHGARYLAHDGVEATISFVASIVSLRRGTDASDNRPNMYAWDYRNDRHRGLAYRSALPLAQAPTILAREARQHELM